MVAAIPNRVRAVAVPHGPVPVKHEASDLPLIADSPEISVEREESPGYSDGIESRTRITTTIKIGGITFSRTHERVILPIERETNAATIVRPPLDAQAQDHSEKTAPHSNG
jgi:hypothetical protein